MTLRIGFAIGPCGLLRAPAVSNGSIDSAPHRVQPTWTCGCGDRSHVRVRGTDEQPARNGDVPARGTVVAEDSIQLAVAVHVSAGDAGAGGHVGADVATAEGAAWIAGVSPGFTIAAEDLQTLARLVEFNENARHVRCSAYPVV